jgi:hypothetical protein
MNLFDYKRKKDLQGRTTQSGKNGSSSEQATRATSTAPNGPAKVQGQNRLLRRRIRNATQDRWFYSDQLRNYQQQVTSTTKSDKTDPNSEHQAELRRKYSRILSDLFANEVIIEGRRRHPIHILYLCKPIWLSLPLIIILLVASIFVSMLLWFGLGLALIDIILLGWFINDWSNDYLIITNRRVVQIERITFIDSDKTEIPLEKIQEIKVDARRSPLEYMFQVGTIVFISNGKTQIKFVRVKKPEELRSAAETMTKSFFMARNAYRKDRTRNYLESKIHNTEPRDWYTDEESRAIDAEENPNWWQRTFPSRPIHDPANKRYIWHTHPWILIKKLFGSALLMFILIIAGIIGYPLLLVAKLGIVTLIISLVYFPTLLLMVGIIWYKYENWHNDRYIVTYTPFQEKVMNITRLPFGFDETNNTVLVRNIQDVQSEKNGVFATLFNFGKVKISVTGGSGIEMNNVPDPEAIRDEISRRIELAKYAQEDVEDRRVADSLIALRDIMYRELSDLWQDPNSPYRNNAGS